MLEAAEALHGNIMGSEADLDNISALDTLTCETW